MSIAHDIIKLFVDFPLAGNDDEYFGLEIPGELSELAYTQIVEQIEFRRRCMNQGFDNLLELLAMARASKAKAAELAARNKKIDD